MPEFPPFNDAEVQWNNLPPSAGTFCCHTQCTDTKVEYFFHRSIPARKFIVGKKYRYPDTHLLPMFIAQASYLMTLLAVAELLLKKPIHGVYQQMVASECLPFNLLKPVFYNDPNIVAMRQNLVPESIVCKHAERKVIWVNYCYSKKIKTEKNKIRQE